jgi:hypothetical protein
MNRKELEAILEKHLRWLKGEEGGERANLSRADLFRANLSGADLSGADLSGANLSGANLSGANLFRASLTRADLSGADLSGADLSGANLSGADLTRADLSGANLSGAENVSEIIWNMYTAFYPLQCPESGAYTAFKKARGLIVELEIPADAIRSSATSRKCRASKAKVISITDVDGNPAGDAVESNYDSSFVYVVGETLEVPDFDADRWKECAPGIHHFITRAEACKYQ